MSTLVAASWGGRGGLSTAIAHGHQRVKAVSSFYEDTVVIEITTM